MNLSRFQYSLILAIAISAIALVVVIDWQQAGDRFEDSVTYDREQPISYVDPATTTAATRDQATSSQATSSQQNGDASPSAGNATATPAQPQPTIDPAHPFAHIQLEAQSAIVWDQANDRALYRKNADRQLPLASVTKLMTALISAENTDNDAIITVSNQDLRAEGESGLYPSEEWRAQDLRDFTLMVSSNDGARALASAVDKEAGEPVFIDLMNQKADELGMMNTHYYNPSGLDLNETIMSGSYGSVRDMVRLIEFALRTQPQVFSATDLPSRQFMSENGISHTAINTNPLVSEIPEITASKTGYTVLAGGNLVVAADIGLAEPVIIAVMGSSRSGRFADVRSLIEATKVFARQSN